MEDQNISPIKECKWCLKDFWYDEEDQVFCCEFCENDFLRSIADERN